MRLCFLTLLLMVTVMAAPRFSNIARHHSTSTPSHRYQHHLGKREVDLAAETENRNGDSSEESYEEDDESYLEDEEEDDKEVDLDKKKEDNKAGETGDDKDEATETEKDDKEEEDRHRPRSFRPRFTHREVNTK